MQRVAQIVLLVSLVSAHVKLEDTHQVLSEIARDSFGGVVLSAIQAHMQAKAPQDEVLLLLNSLLNSIVDDQDQQDNLNSINQAACTRITGDLANNIAYDKAQISSNEILRDDSTEALEQAEIDVRQAVQDIQDNEDTYATEESTRDQQNTVFQSRSTDNSGAIAAVDEAIKLIQHLQLGVSFVQVKTRFENVQKNLAAQTVHQALFKPIIAAMVGLSTVVDEKAIAVIAQLLAEIRQQLVAGNIQYSNTEDRQVEHYTEFSLHLTQEHARLAERKQSLEEAISVNKYNLATAEQYIQHHTAEKESAELTLEDQQEWCDRQTSQYENSTTQRNQQTELITRIQEHVVEHLSASEQFLNSRN